MLLPVLNRTAAGNVSWAYAIEGLLLNTEAG
jgi:hypothetical protein